MATQLNTCLPYEKVGSGPALFLVHGWPFHAESYRHIVPELSKHYTCYVIGSAGMCDEVDYSNLDMSFNGHADRLLQLADELGIERFSVAGHDTGGSIVRFAAAKAPERIERIVCFNTEVPNHRPPFLMLYQFATGLICAFYVMRFLMRRGWFVRSKMGIKGFYYDKSLIESDGRKLYAEHWVSSRKRFNGLVAYLRGLNFKDVDKLATVHQKITAPVLFIWGKDDATFEVKYIRQFVARLNDGTQLVEIPKAAFLVHEEKPLEVVQSMLPFLR